ncbi:MAG: hypothetical protein ACLSAF_20570 [Intestinimonas sp.]
MNPLFVGIDVSSKNNVAYLMKPDGSKHSSFSVQNNLAVLNCYQRESYRHLAPCSLSVW